MRILGKSWINMAPLARWCGQVKLIMRQWGRRVPRFKRDFDQCFETALRGLVGFAGSILRVCAVLAVLLVVPSLLMFWGELAVGWDWLRKDSLESRSTTIRNISLILAGLIGLPFLVWRAVTQDRQAATAQETLFDSRQARLNDQFQRAVDMLSSTDSRVRLAGIEGLKFLAASYAEHYHVKAMWQLCEFVRDPIDIPGQPKVGKDTITFTREQVLSNIAIFNLASSYNDAATVEHLAKFLRLAGLSNISTIENIPPRLELPTQRLREDIQKAIDAIAFCHDKNIGIEARQGYWLDFHSADLTSASFVNMNLSGAPLEFNGFKTPDQLFTNNNRTNLRDTKLDRARFFGANLSNVDLSRATGLTQDQLTWAKADAGSEPLLYDVIDDDGVNLSWENKDGLPLDLDPSETGQSQ